MSSIRNEEFPVKNDNPRRFSDVPSHFRRRKFNGWSCLIPKRYALALMLFLLLLIETWRELNVAYKLIYTIFKMDDAHQSKNSSIGHWTIQELRRFYWFETAALVFAQIPGALLIFIYSSHKFFILAVPATSFLHLLTPVALAHHSIGLLFVLVGQSVISAPIYIAIMTTWKDWAPPTERTKLISFSFYGLFIRCIAPAIYPFITHHITTDGSFYLSGIAGITWVLFWYNITSDTPENDPLLSEAEYIYLGNNIPSDHMQKIKVKDVPWMSIICSKPVLVLCLIFFKMSCSLKIASATVLHYNPESDYNPLFVFVPFASSFVILVPTSAILADFLIRKFIRKTLLIRKIFLCGGFLLQSVFLLGSLASSELIREIFFMMSYSIFAFSIAGFITIPLDLSPRYVSVISGIVFTFYTLGIFCENYIMYTSWLLIFDGSLSLLCTVLFAIWGDAEEQLWSLTFPTNCKTNDYVCYPKPEDEDDLNLVT